jgi:acyl-CoA thioesterase-1
MMDSGMHKPLLRRRHFNWSLLALACWGFAAPVWAAPAQRILVVGDSLSAEYGLTRGTGWVALLQKKLAQEKPGVEVFNASISGETTSGGRSRLAALLQKHQPSHVVIELGGNDALRGLPLNMTQDNLLTMTRQSQAAGAQVLLLGMQMPPNYGPDMARQFEAAYAQVAKSQKAALVPFFLKGIGDDPDPLKWFQADRIHPNEAAQPRMLANVWPTLKKQLK